jgi:isopenicillin-N N-acyltransferase-like protein
VLRDRKGPGASPLPLGHRHAIDALIATHAVVMDATARMLWVSEGPHLAGRFLRFDLAQLLAADYQPQAPARVIALAADDIMKDGSYDAWLRSGSPHSGGQ